MATGGVREAATCGVCSEVYQTGSRDPLVLPCGHTYCRPCLLAVQATGEFLCPSCRKSHDHVPFKTLPVNFSLLSLSSACSDLELKTCSKHDAELQFWCCDCQLPQCGLCLHSCHLQGHKVQLAKSYVQGRKVELETQVEVMKEQLEEGRNRYMEALRDLASLLTQIKEATSIESIMMAEVNVKKFQDSIMSLTSGGSSSHGGVARANDGSPGLLDYQDGRALLHCYALPTIDARLSLKPRPEVFLELSVGDRRLGRLYIRLCQYEPRRTRQFLALCLGTLGPAYLGTRAAGLARRGRPAEALVFDPPSDGDQSKVTRPLLHGPEGGCRYWCGPGAVHVPGPDDVREAGVDPAGSHLGFGITTRGDGGVYTGWKLGEVESGLDVVEAAAGHHPVTDVTISKCGLVVPDLTPPDLA